MRSGAFWIGMGLAVGGVFLLVSLHAVDLTAAMRVALSAKPSYLTLAALASIAFMVAKSWRWCLLLSPIHKLGLIEVLPAVYTGTAVNLIIPHAGEVARAALVARRFGLSTSALLGTIAVERLFDITAVLLYCALLALKTQQLAPLVASASYIALALLGGASLLAVVGLRYTEGFLQLAQRMLLFLSQRWRAAILAQLRAAITGLGALRDAHRLPAVMAQSLLQWGCVLVSIYASVRALGLTTEAVASIAVLVLLVVGLSLPAAPVHVGTTQLGFTLGLAAFQVTAPQAFAASILYTLFVLVPMLLPGLALAVLGRDGVPWATLRAGSVRELSDQVLPPK